MNLKILKPNYRELIVGVNTKVPIKNDREITAINFDNAASTPPFKSVLQEIVNFSSWYSSIHRGTGYKSQISSNLYEEARDVIARFVNIDTENNTVIFVKNTTEAINKLSYRLIDEIKDGVVLSTFMEHHSNDLPWRNKYHVDYVQVANNGQLDLNDLENKLQRYKGAVKLVTVTGASNVTGYLNPIYQIAALAHRYEAKIMVDGAQLVPHSPINMRPNNPEQHIDFLAFSAHKMYAPFGIGVLIGPKEIFEKGSPDYVGGGTIQMVTHDYVKWAEGPEKDEAGSPNVIGVVALVEAINTLEKLGMDNLERYEKSLTDYALRKLRKIPQVEIYGNQKDSKDRVGTISFNIKDMHHETVATILSHEGAIAVRNGCFCAQPYIQKLLKVSPKEIAKHIDDPAAPHPGMVRISFGIYNDYSEIDKLVDLLNTIVNNKKSYLKQYKKDLSALFNTTSKTGRLVLQ